MVTSARRPPDSPAELRLGNPAEGRRALRLGWALLALLPVSFAGAMVVGDWLVTVQGYSSAEANLPPSVALRAGLPAVVVLVLPMVGAAWCGRRADRHRHPGGRALFATAAVVATASVFLNLVQVLAAWVAG